MNMFSALRDAWYFFSHNLAAIARLCLPLIVLEGLLLQQVTNMVAAESATLWRLLAGLLFYPLYSAALILFLDARSQSMQPRARDLLADNALASLLLDCASRFLQLFSSVVLFRLFMLRSAQPEVE